MKKEDKELEEITRKVISYCSIPEELTEDSWISELGCGVYAPYSLSSDPKYSKSELDKYLEKEYPELMDTEFLIDIDY